MIVQSTYSPFHTYLHDRLSEHICLVIYFMFMLVKYVKSISILRSQCPSGRSLLNVARESRDIHPLFTLFVRDGTAAFLM